MFRFGFKKRQTNLPANPCGVANPLTCEALEDRNLLTTYVVNTALDDATGSADGLLSLREAITAANNNAAFGDAVAGSINGDAIQFASSMAFQTIALSLGQLDITDDLSIQAGSLNVTVDAQNVSRVLNISASENVSIGGLRLIRGKAPNGGGVVVSGGGSTTFFRVSLVQNVSTLTGGGGIWNNGDNLYLTECVLDRNSASGSSGRGGGLYMFDGRTAIREGQFKGNNAVRSGGGIEVAHGDLFTTEALIGGTGAGEGNRAGPSGSSTVGEGGGLHVSGTTGSHIAIRGGSFIRNSAAHEGGGLWVPNNTELLVRLGAVVQGNIAHGAAAGDGGGGIFNRGGTVRIVSSTISGNTALGTAGSGGGIYSTAGDVRISGSNITSNSAARGGGGIEIVNGSLLLTAVSKVQSNVAGPTGSANPGQGGGIRVSGTLNPRVVIVGGQVSNNQAQSQGGGIWVNESARVVLRTGAVVSNNQTLAAGSIGGGVYIQGHLQATDSSISSNVAQQAGGGVYVDNGGSSNLFSTTVSSNSGGQFGGGIYNAGFINLSSSIVSNNTVSTNGGGIFEELSATTNLTATNVVNNTPNNFNL